MTVKSVTKLKIIKLQVSYMSKNLKCKQEKSVNNNLYQLLT